jgi:diguanylate cyclase (GGDEF)-like protein/PAS domain S-box-containing protein
MTKTIQNKKKRTDYPQPPLTETALRKSDERLRRITDNMVDLVVQVDLGAVIEFVSPSVKKILGYDIKELIGRNVADFINADDLAYSLPILNLKIGERESKVELRVRHREGHDVWLEVLGSAIRNEEEQIIGVVLGGRNITDRKKKEDELRLSEERYRTILENIEDGYFEVDLTGNLIYASEPFFRMAGTDRETVMGMNFRQYTPKEYWPKIYQSFFEVYSTGESLKELDWDVVRLDGSRLHIEVSVSLIRDAKGRPAGFRGITRDVTGRKQIAENVEWMAYHDLLTGLPNRALFYDHAAMILAQAKRKQRPFGIMMLDLDKFKDVNDNFGHDIGDNVLAAVADRLKKLMRDEDTVARTGGDEFVALLPEVANLESMELVAERIMTTFTNPITVREDEFIVTFSIGTAIYPADGQDIDTLVRHADQSMYAVKTRGREETTA